MKDEGIINIPDTFNNMIEEDGYSKMIATSSCPSVSGVASIR